MAEGKWRPRSHVRKLKRALAQEWGVSASTIDRDAEEASRSLSSNFSPGRLSRVAGLALDRIEEQLDDDDGEPVDVLRAADIALRAHASSPFAASDPAVLVQSMPASERVAWLQRQADGIRRALASLLPRAEYLAALEAEVVERQEEIGELRREGEET